MSRCLDPFRFRLTSQAGWMNQRPLNAMEYLWGGNWVLREHLSGKRFRLNDDQRRRAGPSWRERALSGHRIPCSAGIES